MEPGPEDGSPLVLASSGLPALPAPELRVRRWRLFRNLLVFQAKLVVDGLKDLALGPISLGAAIVGLVSRPHDPEGPFRNVLRLGGRFDRWVDLFGERRPDPPESLSSAASGTATPVVPRSAGLDQYVDRIEKVLVEQYQRGGLTAKAKDAIDEALDALQGRNQPPPS